MNLHDCNDPDLMEALKAGETEVFAVIVGRHQQSLVNFFRRMGRSEHDAEDLAQETFLRLYNYRYRYRPFSKFSSFLYTLARHVWVDEIRRSGKTRQISIETLSDNQIPQYGYILPLEKKIDQQAALSLLPEKLRLVVVLSIFHGLRYREISEILEIPVGTVKSRMYLALQQLKKTFVSETTCANHEK